MIQGRKTRKWKYKRTGYVRVFPALVVDLVHIAIALVVRVLRLRVEYFGLVQEFKVKAEHFLVLGVLGVVCLWWSHGRRICRVVLVLEFLVLCKVTVS